MHVIKLKHVGPRGLPGVGVPSGGDTGEVLTKSSNASFDVEWSSPTGNVLSVFGRSGVVTATLGDYTADEITNVPSGDITSTNVQDALDELDIEKMPKSGGTFSGAVGVKFVIKTSDYNLDDDCLVLADASSAPILLTLPSVADVLNRLYIIKRLNDGDNTVTVQADGAETIDDGSDAVLSAQYESITLVASNLGWHIV